MYSSLYNLDFSTEISIKKLLKLKYTSGVKVHVLLVRNPYARLKSLYKDKFVKFPSGIQPCSNPQWQHFHQAIFPCLSIINNSSTKEIKSRLMNTAFTDFIKILHECYYLDGHMHPQNWIKYISPRLKIPVLKFTGILKMESQNDMNILSDLSGLDINLKHNSTDDVICDTELTPESIGIINKIYRGDFDFYNYSRISCQKSD